MSWDAGTTLPAGEAAPRGVTVASNGDILFAGNHTDRIYRYSSGAWDSGLTLPTSENNPGGVAITSGGDILLSGDATKRIYTYSSGSWDAGIALPSGVTQALGLGVAPNGDILLAGRNTRRIYRRSSGSWDAGIAIPTAETDPRGVALDLDGNFVIVGTATDKVYRRSGDTWDAGIDIPTGETIPTGVAIDPTTGDIILAGNSTDRIYRYTVPQTPTGGGTPVSLFDASITPGGGDPNVPTATSGVLAGARGIQSRQANVNSIHGTARQIVIVESTHAARRYSQRIPPRYVEATTDRYLAFLGLLQSSTGRVAATQLRLASTSTDASGGAGVGDDFTTTAEASIGVAVRAGSLTGKFLLSALNDSSEPYQSTSVFVGASFPNSPTVDWVIVDTADANIDWTNLQARRASPDTGTDVRAQVGLSHPVRGAGTPTVTHLVETDVRAQAGLSHAIQGDGAVTVTPEPGTVSIFDATVTPGGHDPNVPDGTRGVIAAGTDFTPFYENSSSAFHNSNAIWVVSGDNAPRRYSQRIPPRYIQGDQDGFLTVLRLMRAVAATTTPNAVFLHTRADRASAASIVQFTATAEAAIGIAVRDGDGTVVSFLLSDLNDSDNPYTRAAHVFANVGDLSGDLDWAIVDTTDANIDWPNLQVREAVHITDVRAQASLSHAARGDGTPTVTPPVETVVRAQAGSGHAVRGDADVTVTIEFDIRAGASLSHGVRGDVDVTVLPPADIRAQAGLSHPVRGAGLPEVANDVRARLRGRINRLRHAVRGDGTPRVAVDIRAQAGLSHAARGDGTPTVTPPVEVDVRAQAGLQHAVRGAGSVVVTLPITADVRVRLGRTYTVRGGGMPIVTPPAVVVDLPLPPPVLENVVQARIGGRYASQVDTDPRLPNAGKIASRSMRASKGLNMQGTCAFELITHTDQIGRVRPTRNQEVIITARAHDEPLVEGHDFRSYIEDLTPTTLWSMDEGDVRGAIPAGYALRHITAFNAAIPAGSAYTLHAFIRFVSPPHHDEMIVECFAQAPGSSIRAWRLAYTGMSEITLDVYTTSQRIRRTFAVQTMLDNPLAFHQVVVRADAAGLTLLVDGEAVAGSAPLTTTSQPPFTVPNDTARFSNVNGFILDEVAVWDEVVEADDIAALWSLRDVRRLFGGLVRTSSVRGIGSGDLSAIQIDCKSFANRAHELKIEGYVRTLSNRAVGDLARQIVTDHMAGEGISLAGIRDSTAIQGDVWDYISPAQAFTRICDQANAVWCIDDYRTLWIVPRNAVRDPGLNLTESDFDNPAWGEDDRLLRSRQTVIGGSPQSGQRRDDFAGDGSTKEFRLEFRLDRIIEVSVNGVTVDASGSPGSAWSIDRERSIIVQSDTAQPLRTDQTLSVLYNYNFPIVVTVESAAAKANYGTIQAVKFDPSIDTVELAESIADAELDRHDAPMTVISAPINRGKVSEIREGWGLRTTFTKWQLPEVLYLIDRVDLTVDGFVLRWIAELLARDHEPRYSDFYDALNTLPVPTELTARAHGVGPGTPGITPEQLGIEGLRLPVVLGGSESFRIRSSQWARIPGSGIARLNGDRLPSNLIEWYATVQCIGGVTGQVRLYNRTLGQQLGLAVQTTSANADLVYHRRITLSSGLNNYELQGRVTEPAARGSGLLAWAGAIDVGD